MHCMTITIQDKPHDIEVKNKKLISVDLVREDKTHQSAFFNIKQIVLEYTYNLELLTDLGIRKEPKTSIFRTLMLECNKVGISPHTRNTIYNIFNTPEYAKYKYQDDTNKKINNDPLELADRAVINDKALDTIYFLKENENNPILKTHLDNYYKERKKKEIKEKKDRLEAAMIRMQTPPGLERGEGRDSLTYRAMEQFWNIIKDNMDRIWRYPPDQKNDKWYASGIESMAAMFVPGSDLKYARDFLSYCEIMLERVNQGIHASSSKSKIPVPEHIITKSNKFVKTHRPLTREQIADLEPVILNACIFIAENFPGLIHLLLYQIYEQKPYAALFAIDRHDKLSDSAFGQSTMM